MPFLLSIHHSFFLLFLICSSLLHMYSILFLYFLLFVLLFVFPSLLVFPLCPSLLFFSLLFLLFLVHFFSLFTFCYSSCFPVSLNSIYSLSSFTVSFLFPLCHHSFQPFLSFLNYQLFISSCSLHPFPSSFPSVHPPLTTYFLFPSSLPFIFSFRSYPAHHSFHRPITLFPFFLSPGIQQLSFDDVKIV